LTNSTKDSYVAELPTILDSFYTTITNDHIGVEIGGGGELLEVNTARSHLRPIWTLDIKNSSQFDGQAFWPVVWWFPAGWMLVYSCHCHLKITRAFKHIRQARENSPKKSRPVNHWQWYTHGSLVHWCSNWLVVKSVHCHLVWTIPVFANLVTYMCWLKISLYYL